MSKLIRSLCATFGLAFVALAMLACGGDGISKEELAESNATLIAQLSQPTVSPDIMTDQRVLKIVSDYKAGTIKTTDAAKTQLKALGYTEEQVENAFRTALNGLPTPTAPDKGGTPTQAANPTATTAAQSTPTIRPQVTTTVVPDNSPKPKWLGSECKVAPTIPTVSAGFTKGFTASESLAYPDIAAANPGRSGPRFPDTNEYGYPPRAGYEESSEDANYFEDCFGDLDVPQYYHRVNTAGYFWIPKSEDTPEDIVCMATETKGCALITINHFGPTMKLNGVYVDNGFTYFGRVWDMSQPQMVTDAAQSLLDHVTYRMIYGDTPQDGANDGTNCGDINGCMEVEWHVVVYGGNKLQKHWMGIYQP